MRYPAFVEALGREENRRYLAMGIVSGYVVTTCFGLLIAGAVATGIMQWHWMLAALVGLKLGSNTLALLAIRMKRLYLEAGFLNVVTDAVVLTGAIWITGDTRSPLIAVYVLEISVLALLTNLETTIAVGFVVLSLYVTMGVTTARGILPRFPTPAEWAGHDSAAYITMASFFTAFVIAAPTIYTSGILRRLRENERRLEARTRALIDAGKQKAQFMANISHELRTPLQGVIGLSDLVARGVYGVVTDRQRDAMGNVKTQAKSLLQLIDDLLQLAAADAGKLELKPSEVDLAEVLPGAVATIRWLLSDKQLRVEMDVEDALPHVFTDRAKLNQVVLNLLSNAVKFTPEGGALWIRARKDEDEICIEVEDTGVGIPEHEISRVFDEFYQVDGSSSREFGGAGLGLALVRRLLDVMGGSITVRSTVGRGSTFRVRLPMTATTTSETAS